MSDTESEYEWNYYCYGIDKRNGDMIVAGGGLGNGNAYAVVRKEKDETSPNGDGYYYMEFGKYPYREYIGNVIKIDYEEKQDDMFSFDIAVEWKGYETRYYKSKLSYPKNHN